MSLPPLKALPVFEAVARLNSFSKAAEELHVTQSAISHNIKALEEFLGEALFVRQGKLLSLTSEGKRYLDNISASLLQIQQATNQLKGQQTNQFRMAVYSSFAVYWLIPRLTDFLRLNPQIDLSIEMMHLDPELSDRVGDCFITIDNNHKGYLFEHLYRERLFPVCSQQFYRQMETQLKQVSHLSMRDYLQAHPDWLAQFPLVTTFSIFDKYAEDWRLWFESIGMPLPDNLILRSFSHLMLGKEAALHHHGIALINDYMYETQAVENELVKLPCHDFETGSDFYFAYKHSRRHEPELMNIRHWLRQQSNDLN